jgi:hypothetical protein
MLGGGKKQNEARYSLNNKLFECIFSIARKYAFLALLSALALI